MTSKIIIGDVNDMPLRNPPIPGIPVKNLLDESNSKSMRAGLMSWPPGAKSPTQPHLHSVEELQLVVNGHATLTDCNGDRRPLRPGTMFLCPPGPAGVHAIHNSSDLAMTLLFIYPQPSFETQKFEVGRGERLQSTILLQDIESIKADPVVDPKVRTKRLCGTGNSEYSDATITWCEPGAKLTGGGHYHSTEEFQLVLYGQMELTDGDGKTHVLREGGLALCPAGSSGTHRIENTSDFPMCLLVVHPLLKYETKTS
jgi:quercetin dioxygenase-like cupin family protein